MNAAAIPDEANRIRWLCEKSLLDLSPKGRDRPWYVDLAMEKLRIGHYRAVLDRGMQDLYLLRMWISTPVPVEGEEQWESARSTLLHFFPRPDMDPCLHDHPWSFRTTILAGGYVEHLPPADWRPFECRQGPNSAYMTRAPGPAWDQNKVIRLPGQVVEHEAEDLHCVGALLEHTAWTLVTTGQRGRKWGFHPPDQKWMTWPEYQQWRKSQGAEA